MAVTSLSQLILSSGRVPSTKPHLLADLPEILLLQLPGNLDHLPGLLPLSSVMRRAQCLRDASKSDCLSFLFDCHQ
jgi:hypothetical protein